MSAAVQMDALKASRLGYHVGNGKLLFAVAIERGWRRIPDVIYFAAKSVEDVKAELLKGVLTFVPEGSRVVGVAPAIGEWHDERGEVRLA